MSKKKETEPEYHFMSYREAQWIAMALYEPKDRPILSHAWLAHYDDAAYLVATDTHRMHMLRLCQSEAFEPKSVDIRRIIAEAQLQGSVHISFAADFESVMVGGHTYSPVYGPVFPEFDGTHPNVSRVIPSVSTPPSQLFAINARYLQEAAWLGHEQRVTLSQNKPNEMILLRDPENKRWMAVVMPMNWRGWYQ